MANSSVTAWFRLRVAFALGVLVLLALELAGDRPWPVLVLQVLLIAGIVLTSVFDLRDLRSRRASERGR